MAKSLEEFLKLPDPLGDEAMIAVLDAREENSFIDYKLDFENVDREWLEVTKDVMSFANTEGGYLAFGIKNGTYEQVGLSDGTVSLLSDPNNLMQKFNKCVDPPFTNLRSKSIERNGKKFVVIFIPPSLGHTHLVFKDGTFDHQSGSPKTVLRQGTFYVRRSGANHLGDARDLDAIVERRINRFRTKLLEGITRVVESPIETEVLVVKQEGASTQGPDKKFVIENAPDAIGVKGMSFSVAPETMEQEIAAWVAMSKANPKELPSAGTIWKWYAARERLQITQHQKIQLAAFSLRRCAPAFYWLQGGIGEEIKEALTETMKYRDEPESIANILAVSAYFGKRFHKSQVTKVGVDAKRFGKVSVYPASGPRAYFEALLVKRRQRAEMATELDRIAKSAENEWNGQPALTDRWNALRLDSFLYAQDEYPNNKPEKQSEADG
jgi:hypothetical protein